MSLIETVHYCGVDYVHSVLYPEVCTIAVHNLPLPPRVLYMPSVGLCVMVATGARRLTHLLQNKVRRRNNLNIMISVFGIHTGHEIDSSLFSCQSGCCDGFKDTRTKQGTMKPLFKAPLMGVHLVYSNHSP